MNNLISKSLHVFILLTFFFSIDSSAQPQTNFKAQDIGKPAIKGDAQIVTDGVDIKAGGEDIWMNSDQFHFVYKQIEGDFDFVARLESLERSHLYTKAGLMARETLTSRSRNVMFLAFPGNDKRNNNLGGYEFQYRLEKGKESKAIYPSLTDTVAQASFPANYPNVWLRLKRKDATFSAYTSADGINWVQYTEFVMEMPKKIYLRMAATAHIKGATTVAKFRNLQMNQ